MFRVQFLDPMLISEAGSDSAVALDSVTFVRDPFPLTNLFNFSGDHRTRLMLFGMNMELMAGEDSSAVTGASGGCVAECLSVNGRVCGQVPGVDCADADCCQIAG